jgi:regulation of enolase protein 1 (concanavalin A-like superfamily)
VLGDAGGREARFGIRATSGKPMSFALGNGYSATLPTWFRLERHGNTFAGYQSDNGQEWFKVSSSDIRMEHAARAGIAIASDNKEGISVTFDHVCVTPAN